MHTAGLARRAKSSEFPWSQRLSSITFKACWTRSSQTCSLRLETSETRILETLRHTRNWRLLLAKAFGHEVPGQVWNTSPHISQSTLSIIEITRLPMLMSSFALAPETCNHWILPFQQSTVTTKSSLDNKPQCSAPMHSCYLCHGGLCIPLCATSSGNYWPHLLYTAYLVCRKYLSALSLLFTCLLPSSKTSRPFAVKVHRQAAFGAQCIRQYYVKMGWCSTINAVSCGAKVIKI